MLKVAILVVLVLGAGAAGYFGERFLRPTKAPEPANATAAPALYFNLPLGRFTLGLRDRTSDVYLVFNLEVYIQGAEAFQQINGSVGKTRLRDATVTALSKLSVSDVMLIELVKTEEGKARFAEMIALKLHADFPTVKAARVQNLLTHGEQSG